MKSDKHKNGTRHNVQYNYNEFCVNITNSSGECHQPLEVSLLLV